MRVFITLDIKKLLKPILLVAACFIMLWASSSIVKSTSTIMQKNKEYVILAYNDIGMHCIQSDYSSFMILPPANTIRVQVFEKGIEEAKLINGGVIVEYSVNNNTSSIDKVNFWEYAKAYGYNLKPNEGITGNYLSGICKLSVDKKYYEAEYIPITPYNDGSKIINPYQTVTITVKNAITKRIIAVEDAVVAPVSTEISFYTPAALGFAIFSSILFTVYMRNLFEKNFLKIMIINTVIIIIISATTAFSSFPWLIILWIVMLPLIPKIIFFRTFKNIWAHVSHIGVLLLITGTITSSVFSEEGILMQAKSLKIPSGKIVTIHKFLGDTIINESLKYTTRPFIWLFWVGGFMILGGILGELCFSKRGSSE